MAIPYPIIPLFKSVGAKTQLLPELLKRVPPFKRYIEPMVGGGALLWALHRAGKLDKAAVILADDNPYVMNAYAAVRDDPEAIIDRLDGLHTAYHDPKGIGPSALYYGLRGSYNEGSRDPATFIFLRQTSFNGLWRHNKRGLLNMAWGKYAQPRLLQPENIRAISTFLKRDNVKMFVTDVCEFTRLAQTKVRKGDFVYIDPPYWGTFNKFTSEGVSKEQHLALIERMVAWQKAGAFVLYSNAAAPEIVEALSRTTALVETVHSRAMMNRDGKGRGLKPELLVTFKP